MAWQLTYPAWSVASGVCGCVSWGVCIPEQCQASDVRRSLFPSPLFDELSSQVGGYWVLGTGQLP